MEKESTFMTLGLEKMTIRIFFLFFFGCLLFPVFAGAGESDERRVWVGLELYPAILSADMDIGSKTGSDGRLNILVVYSERTDSVEMVRYLREIESIRGIPVNVSSIRIDAFPEKLIDIPAGIFIADRLRERLKDFVKFAKKNQVALFSPFAGDVERGVPFGMVVSDRILPYINRTSLEQSGFRIRPFFMRISEIYGK